MNLRILITLLCFSSYSPIDLGAGDIPADPKEAAEVFYTELRRLGLHSLPTVEGWAPLAPRATEELSSAITRAQKEQAEFKKKSPDEKPPWVDGDLFSSLFEGPQTSIVGPATVTGDSAEVAVTCTRTEGGDTIQWTDFLILKKTAKGWLIDDLRYGGKWDFAATGTLRQSLATSPE
jgi:hypothetical protein